VIADPPGTMVWDATMYAGVGVEVARRELRGCVVPLMKTEMVFRALVVVPLYYD
jgi:hypothetical protein